VLPRDWGTLIRLLGEVGSATGALGAMAYQTVAEASKRARVLVHVVTNRHMTGDPARELERQIKQGIAARLGPLGGPLGTACAKLAVWFDPTLEVLLGPRIRA